MRSPPGKASPTATTCARPGPSADQDGHRARARRRSRRRRRWRPRAPTAGQRPKCEIVPPPGAASPSRATVRHATVLDREDRRRDRRELEHAVERDDAGVVEGDALGELGEDPAERRVLAGADHHPDPLAARRRRCRPAPPCPRRPRRRPPRRASLSAGGPKRGEGAPGGRGVALGDDLPQRAARADGGSPRWSRALGGSSRGTRCRRGRSGPGSRGRPARPTPCRVPGCR